MYKLVEFLSISEKYTFQFIAENAKGKYIVIMKHQNKANYILFIAFLMKIKHNALLWVGKEYIG